MHLLTTIPPVVEPAGRDAWPLPGGRTIVRHDFVRIAQGLPRYMRGNE
jgi:hypothetical protein